VVLRDVSRPVRGLPRTNTVLGVNGLAVPGVLVDGSNICRDRSITPKGTDASWARLESLLLALPQTLIAFPSFYVVADRSLYHRLDEPGRQSLRLLEREGRLEQAKFADEKLVDLAFSDTSNRRGWAIATLDRLVDFRRRYPELDHADAVAWTASEHGIPSPFLREFGPRPHRLVSMREEEGELYERGLRRLEVQDRAAASHWRCTTASCPVAQLWPDQLEELPRYDEIGNRFICPSCGEPVERRGPRSAAVSVIVFADGVEAGRLLLEEGAGLDIGRVAAQRCIGLERLLPDRDIAQISRRHIHLRLQGQEVAVRDLDSTNGTRIGNLDDSRSTARRLDAGRDVVWRLHERIYLPAEVDLERSGRRLPIRGEAPNAALETDPSAPKTKLSESGAASS